MKNRIIKYVTTTVAVLSVLAATALRADQVATAGTGGDHTGFGPWQAGSGGEFTLKILSGMSWVPGAYAPATQNQGGVVPSFQTFCVEEFESISGNTTYDYTLSDTTRLTNIKLTQGAAYLYAQFARGTLAGYDYLNSGAGRKATASQLQLAIWYFMGQVTLGQAGGAGATFVAAGLANGGLSLNNGLYPVDVVNMWKVGQVGRSQVQDVLVYHPGLPDGGMTLGFIGLAVAGLGLLGRRME